MIELALRQAPLPGRRGDRFRTILSRVMRILFAASVVAVGLVVACAHSAFAEDSARDSSGSSPKAEPSREGDLVAISFRQKGQKQTVKGRVIVAAADGGILFQGVDGVLWLVERNELEGREQLGTS